MREPDNMAEDATAELYKKGGQNGKTYDSHITTDTTAAPSTVPNN